MAKKYRIRFTDATNDGEDVFKTFTEEPNDDFVVADIFAYSDEHLLNLMERVVESPLGMWYWVTDLTNGTTFVSGACDAGDIELVREYLEEEA